MPKKAKEKIVEKDNKITSKSKITKSSKKDKISDLKEVKKTTVAKKATVTKATSVKSTKKTIDEKNVAKSSTVAKKQNTTSKANTQPLKKTSAKSKTKTPKKVSTKSSKKVTTPIEYYDLPVFYNKTVVKVLAQTPFCLFVYWEVSEEDKKNFEKKYGTSFFQDTRPYLIVTNETKNYHFELEVSDYANSWYIHISDSDCKYKIELVRKPINSNSTISESHVSISSSNVMNSPNDHILFDKLGKTIFFRNTKTNIVKAKDITSISFLSNLGKIYNIYDFYKEIYKNELNGDELGTNLSSSQFSSTFK